MLKNNVTQDMANIVLRQAGAVEIKNTPAHVNKVKFKLDKDINVTYIYEVKEGFMIYLSRVRPYSMFLGSMKDEDELVEKILADFNRFKFMYESKCFHEYLDIANGIQTLTEELEKLFISRVTPYDELVNIEEALKNLRSNIEALKDNPDSGME